MSCEVLLPWRAVGMRPPVTNPNTRVPPSLNKKKAAAAAEEEEEEEEDNDEEKQGV